MGQITLRGLDPDLEQKIRNEAKREGKSINKFIADVISRSDPFRQNKKPPKARSLKALAGGWSAQEADQFFKTIQRLEKIDEDLWK
ncbi:MAG: toxin-antitoxin system HicB family antitoxin [Deltaproteobacteria bacterium]|nr:toxin-antitoxin system HicB family antitoxin [Deltaproteobacteria bacterium]